MCGLGSKAPIPLPPSKHRWTALWLNPLLELSLQPTLIRPLFRQPTSQVHLVQPMGSAALQQLLLPAPRSPPRANHLAHSADAFQCAFQPPSWRYPAPSSCSWLPSQQTRPGSLALWEPWSCAALANPMAHNDFCASSARFLLLECSLRSAASPFSIRRE